VACTWGGNSFERGWWGHRGWKAACRRWPFERTGGTPACKPRRVCRKARERPSPPHAPAAAASVWDAPRVGRDGRGGVAAEWNVGAAIWRVVLLLHRRPRRVPAGAGAARCVDRISLTPLSVSGGRRAWQAEWLGAWGGVFGWWKQRQGVPVGAVRRRCWWRPRALPALLR